MAAFSGRVIGTLILGHFLRTRAGRPGQGSALECTTPFAARTSTARKLAIGSGAIAVARTRAGRRSRTGSWRRSGRRPAPGRTGPRRG